MTGAQRDVANTILVTQLRRASTDIQQILQRLLREAKAAGRIQSMADVVALAKVGGTPEEAKVVLRVFDPIRPMPPWPVVALVLDVLRATEKDKKQCQKAFRVLLDFGAVGGQQRPRDLLQDADREHKTKALPAEVAAATTPARFMQAVRDLRAASGISLRGLEQEMRRKDSKHVWGKTALGDLLGKDVPPAKPQHLRNLLAVLCAEANKPISLVEDYMWAWGALSQDKQTVDDLPVPSRSPVSATPQIPLSSVVPTGSTRPRRPDPHRAWWWSALGVQLLSGLTLILLPLPLLVVVVVGILVLAYTIATFIYTSRTYGRGRSAASVRTGRRRFARAE